MKEEGSILNHRDSERFFPIMFNHTSKQKNLIHLLKPTTKLGKRVKWFFETYNVFYQNNEVGDSINNYLNICKRG